MSLLEADSLPTPARAPEISITDLVPPSVRERVGVGPLPDWVSPSDFDEEFHSESEGSVTYLLIDHQCRALDHSFYHRSVRRLETMGAVQSESQWRLNSFDPATQQLVLHSILIRREGRNIDQTYLEKMRFLQREAGLECSFAIDGSITLILLLDDVRVGDIIDASYTITSIPRLLPDRFWSTTCAPFQTPVGVFHVSVRFPSGRKMQSRNSPDFGMRTARELDDETEWSWKRNKIVPREIEPGVPPWQANTCCVAVSDCTSWAEVAQGATEAWREDFDSEEVLRCARNLAAQGASLAEQVNLAITFVQDSIRYLSVNTEHGGQVPTASGQVLRQRYGDCKDKSFLLAHLLRFLGVPARPVLVNTCIGRSVANLLPSPDAFDHAIVEYELQGRRFWVDPTIAFQGGDARSRHVGDYRTGLPLAPGVEDLEPIGTSPSLDTYELCETFRVDATGRPALLIVTRRATGRHADELRQQIGMLGAEAIYRRREQHYKQLFPEARRIQKLEWQDQRQFNEFRSMESYELPRVLTPLDGGAFSFRFGSTLLQHQLALPASGKRRSAYALSQAKNVTHRIEVESPTLARGESILVQRRDEAFRFFCETKKLFGKWSFHFTLRFTEEEIPAVKFEKFRERVKELLPLTIITLVLSPGANAAAGSRRGRTLAGTPSAPGNGSAPRIQAATEDPGQSPEREAVSLPASPAPPLHSLAKEEKIAPATTLGPRLSVHQESPQRANLSESTTSQTELATESGSSLSPAISDEASLAGNSRFDPPSPRRKRGKPSQKWIIPVLLLVFAILTGFVWMTVVLKSDKPLLELPKTSAAQPRKRPIPHANDRRSESNADLLGPAK